MRELVFKNLTSGDKKRRDLYITETVDKNGMRTITRRHSVYIIAGHNRIENVKDIMDYKNAAPENKSRRHVFVFKKHDTKLKKDTFVCDVVGRFYAVVKDGIYSVAFKHSFEVDFLLTTNK